jgi:hypothetical protein
LKIKNSLHYDSFVVARTHAGALTWASPSRRVCVLTANPSTDSTFLRFRELAALNAIRDPAAKRRDLPYASHFTLVGLKIMSRSARATCAP